MLQTGIKLYLQLYFTSTLLLIFMHCSIKVTWQKSRQSHLPVFWTFSLQNLGESPKSLHVTSEWINSDCHRLISLCPPFHFCWKWGVRHSPSFAIPQLSPTCIRVSLFGITLVENGAKKRFHSLERSKIT